ncbi:MAG: hypothetical protein WCX16_05990 [Candidatus Omnitrophota bacterium]|jgi:hypothetical protein
MKKPFRAQSTLEFMMIIILVLAGVVIMGPYVIRSVNAYMRSWENAASQAQSNPSVVLEPWEIPGGPPPPPPPTCEDFEDNPSDCEMNNGQLDCTWVQRWYSSGDPNQPCWVVEDCAETANLEAGIDCQASWHPGIDCCSQEAGCAICPH